MIFFSSSMSSSMVAMTARVWSMMRVALILSLSNWETPFSAASTSLRSAATRSSLVWMRTTPVLCAASASALGRSFEMLLVILVSSELHRRLSRSG